MCGIVGIVGCPPQDTRVIDAMTATLSHRGPDDRGIWISPEAHLGHTRLSILDLSSAGHQPMEYGNLALTYNGEIYNYRELRKSLDGPFHSDSDTEVLLRLLSRDGLDCVHRLRGMYSFAAWDRKRRRLLVARDRLGIKPFYYRELDGGLAFASEAKALFPLGRPQADLSALRDVLTYGYVPTPKSAWKSIRKLPAGHTLVWQENRLQIDRYWCPDPTDRITDMGEACERLHELLAEIVPMHTLSDVPVGVFLSGGIDSTVITSFLERPRTFTIGKDVSRRSEAPAARRVASHFETIHREENATRIDLERALDAMPTIFDEPYGDSAAWAVWLVSRLARSEVTVALSGEGGDELFCGYQWYSRFFERGGAMARSLAAVAPPFTDIGRSAHRKSASGISKYASFLTVFTEQQRRALVGPRLENVHEDDLWHIRSHWREDLDPIRRMQWVDLHTYLPDAMLTKVDRASMAHSLEVRPPMLDHRLVEFAIALHSDLQRNIEGNKGKLVIRELMKDRVPLGHFDLPKRGFNLPIRQWLRRHPGMLDSALDRLADFGLIRRPRIANFKGEQAWALLVLDRWATTSSTL